MTVGTEGKFTAGPCAAPLLKRGMAVIINDCDEPAARLLAILTRFDANDGVWHAEYLSTYPHRRKCSTEGMPTRITLFGMCLAWKDNAFRCEPTGEPCIATYHDGVPRRWQDPAPDRWWPSRKRPAALAKALGQTET